MRPAADTGRAGRRGISLLEVMISMSVLLVVFMSISFVITATRRTQETVLEEETALFHAEGVKEAIAGETFNQIPVNFPADGTDITTLPAGAAVTRTLQGEQITVGYPGWDWAAWDLAGQNPAEIPDPLTIDVQVQWTTVGGSGRTLTLTVARSSSVPN